MPLPSLAPITPPLLHTPRLLLRPLTESDRSAYLHFHTENDAFFRPWSPLPDPAATPDSIFTDTLHRADHTLNAGTALRLAAFTHAGELVGLYNLFDLVRGVSQRASASWRTAQSFTRQGLAFEAMTALIDHAFSPAGLSLHRVEAAVIPTNTPSLRLAGCLAFRQEGYAERYLHIAGQWQDHLLLARLADDDLPRA